MKKIISLLLFMSIPTILECRMTRTTKPTTTTSALSSRSHQTMQKKSGRRRTTVKEQPCSITVHGIECAICAQTVCALIEKYGGLRPEIKCHKNDFSDARIHFIWPQRQNNIDIVQLAQELKKEGFEGLTLKGPWYGAIESQENGTQFVLNELDLKAPMSHEHAIPKEKTVQMQATVTIELDSGKKYLII